MEYIDNNEAYLGCCRQDKKCNVVVLPMYKHFFLLREEWSDWRRFSTYSKGRSPNRTFGQAVMYLKIHYVDKYKHYQCFTFSPFFPNPGIAQPDYDPRLSAFSLRPGSYTATINVKINESLNNSDDHPFVTRYEEIVNFNVPESGSVVLTLLATVGAKYRTYEKVLYDLRTRIERELIENTITHKALVLDGEQARKYYKWWDHKDEKLDLIPTGTPWGFDEPKTATKSSVTRTSPTPKPVAKPAPKSVAKPKPTATRSTTAPKSVAKPKTTATKASPAPKPVAPAPRPSVKLPPPAVPIAKPRTVPTQRLELKTTTRPKLEIKK